MVDILEREANGTSGEDDGLGDGIGELAQGDERDSDEFTAKRFEDLLQYKPDNTSAPGSMFSAARRRKKSTMVGLAADGGLARATPWR